MNQDLQNYIGRFGLCVWMKGSHDSNLIALLDQDRFYFTYAIFECIGTDGKWLKVKYQNEIYQVSPQLFKEVKKPIFLNNEEVFIPIKECRGIIRSMTWHFKLQKPIYKLNVNGKTSSRRYFEEELEKLT